MGGQILGIPQSEYEYEFMVVTKQNCGNYKFHSNHENYEDAEKEAKRIGGIITQNLRVSHKQKKSQK